MSIGSDLPLTGTLRINRKLRQRPGSVSWACAAAVMTISKRFAMSAMRAATLTTSP